MTDTGPACAARRERNRYGGESGLRWPDCYAGAVLERHYLERGEQALELPWRWEHIEALGAAVGV